MGFKGVWYRDLWGWDRVKDTIRSLAGRLGFEKGKELRFFKLRLDLETGEIFDELLGRYLTEKERAGLYFVLHIHSKADDIGLSGELITISQVCPALHCPMFNENVKAFEIVFGYNRDLLYHAAESFGYEKIDIGDAAVKIYTLPRVPVVVGIWLGEEGIPPSSIILYDKTVTHYLDCEAAEILGGALLARLIMSLATRIGIDVKNVRYSYRYHCVE